MTDTITMTETSPDISITKTELFDVDFARWVVDNKSIPKDDRTMVSRYLKNRVRGNEHDTTYKLGKLCKGEFLGRFCAIRSESLQCFPRDIRNALAMKYYWDLDMVNAQPTLLVQYCEKQGWICDALKKYVAQREEMLTLIADTCNIERWEAKQRVVAILFGSGVDADMPDFFRNEFYAELRTIMKNNWTSKTYKWLEKQPNPYGRAIAYTLQTEERKCLLAMDKSLTRHKRSLDVLIHDGGLVRKKIGENALSESLLREVEKDILADTGYTISLCVKPMTTSFEMEIDNVDEEYKVMKEEFEKTHFKLLNPLRYVRKTDTGFQYLTETDINFMYKTKRLSDDSKFIERWTNDDTIPVFERFEFMPNKEPAQGCYNLFRGFPLEPKKGDWSVIHNLIWDLSGRNQENYDYIIKWTAHMFQKPYEKPEVVLIFSSAKEGVGKDTFADHVLRPLLSQEYYFSTTDHENEFFGRFTSHLQNKLLIKLEEMNYEVMNRNDDKLKGWITCTTKSFEEKGVTHTPNIQSFHRFIGTTNEACPVKLTQSFRRYLLVNPYQGNAGNIQHWKNVYTELKKPEVLQAFLDHVLSVDITEFNPRDKCETTALIEARQSQAPPHARFFENFIQEHQDSEEVIFIGNELLKLINLQCKYPYSPFKLAQELKIYPHTKTHTKRGNEYLFKLADVKQTLQQHHWWVDL